MGQNSVMTQAKIISKNLFPLSYPFGKPQDSVSLTMKFELFDEDGPEQRYSMPEN